MISFQKTIPYYHYYLVYESKNLMQGKIIVSFLKRITSYYRYCNLQRNSEALKAKKDTHTYAHIHEHTPHEEHWHTYAHIHEHTFTQHNRKNIGTYTTHTHSRERVLTGIHHAHNKDTLSHTRDAHNTQIQRHTLTLGT